MTHTFKRFSLATLSAACLLALAGCNPPPAAPAPDKAPAPVASASTVAGATVNLDKVKALVAGASHGSAQVVSVFPGKDGMTGAVTQTPGHAKEIIWISPGGSLLFPGPAITIDGQNLSTSALTDQHVYITSSELADKVQSRGFVVGTKGPILTAFMDPNCSWCHELYKNIMPRVKKGELRIRFIMVGILKPSSIPRAVAIMAAKDPAAALAKDENGFVTQTEEGGLPPLKDARPDIEAQIQENVSFMGEAGQISTPGLLFCDKSAGNKLVYIQGYPQDQAGFVAKLGTEGHPSCSK